MDVVFFNREKREVNFSIEELFCMLKKEFEKKISFSDFYFDKNKSRLSNILTARKFQGNINHITGDVNFLALGLNGSKTILTVHDLGFFENPIHKWHTKLLYKLLWLSLPLKKVKYITTVSQFTKDKIKQYFPYLEKKIIVIHNPYNPIFKFSQKPFNVEKPRILLIGTGDHKNHNRLFEAVKNISCSLSIIGKLTSEQKTILKNYKIEYTNDYALTLADVYKKYLECDLLYFASLYEGFGLPIIEANAVGRPVITSNIASMPEVAGNSALLVDPYSVNEIRTAIIRLIENEALRQQLIENGKKNIEKFEISKIANQYLSLYKKVEEENK